MKLMFEHPPVAEQSIGVYFEPIYQLKSHHIGLFWTLVKSEFSKCSEHAPVGDYDAALMVEDDFAPIGRYLFENDSKNSLIQLQRDAFILNWRKEDCEYPNYENVKRVFDKYFQIFKEFLKNELNYEISKIRKQEIVYLNTITSNEIWNGFRDLNKAIPGTDILRIGKYEDKLTGYNLVFPLKFDDSMFVKINIRNGKKIDSGEEGLLVELKAEGFKSDSINQLDNWYDDAHMKIREIFVSLFSERLQKDLWKVRNV